MARMFESEKKGTISTARRKSNMVFFLCRRSNLTNGLVKLVTAMKRSLDSMSPTSNFRSSVALGVSWSALAAFVLNSWRWTFIWNLCGSNHQILPKFDSEMALVGAFVSMRPPMVVSLKLVGKNYTLLLFFHWRFVDNRKNFLFLPGIVWNSRTISASMTGF